jgi:Ca2+-binding RTX toxin-like protein
MRTMYARTLWMALSCAAASLMIAPLAHASTVSVSGTRLVVTPAVGEVNALTITGGAGSFTFSDSSSPVVAGAGCTSGGTGQASCPSASVALIVVDTGDLNDTITNNTATPVRASGGVGNDTINGGAGNDTLIGNGGVDTLNGNAGDDTIVAKGDVSDVVTCGAGNDTVTADPVDRIAADCENVTGRPAPTPPGSAPSSGGNAGSAPTSAEAAPGGSPLPPADAPSLKVTPCSPARVATVATLFGTIGADRIAGTPAGDSLYGLSGNDAMSGLRGDDCLFGGDGNDVLAGDDGVDVLHGENGNDTLVGGRNADRLYGEAGNDKLIGGLQADRLSGGAGGDRLSGGSGDDILAGGAGADVIRSGPGRNRVTGGAGNDTIDTRNGNRDRVDCGPGRDTVSADRVDVLRRCEVVRGVRPARGSSRFNSRGSGKAT